MTHRPFPQHNQAMANPRLVEKAIRQTAEMGSEYACIPLHSYETWVLDEGEHFIGTWFMVRERCFSIDDEYDDELIIFCLKPRNHEGEHGKPPTR